MTGWNDVPGWALAGVMRKVFRSLLGLRFKYEERAHTLLEK